MINIIECLLIPIILVCIVEYFVLEWLWQMTILVSRTLIINRISLHAILFEYLIILLPIFNKIMILLNHFAQ